MRCFGFVLMMLLPTAVVAAPQEVGSEAVREAEVAKALEDPAAVKLGEKQFLRCKSCHMVGEGAQHRVGPTLNGVVGRKAAAADGYNRFSPGMRKAAADGLVWTVENLDAYLKNPRAVVSGGTMSFAGIPVAQQRKAIIAYLATFKEDGSRVSP